MNLKQLIEASTKKFGEKVLYREEEISYSEFQRQINNLGTALIDLGLKEKKIAIISENRYEWEVTFFSVVCGVGVIVPIDKSSTKIEIENIINKARVEAVFCSRKYEMLLKQIKKESTYLKHIISFDSNDEISFKSLLFKGQVLIDNNQTIYTDAKLKDEEICIISFTSGTTSSSKAVMLSHQNVCSNTINVSKVLDITEKDNFLSVLPLNHVLEGLFCLLLSIQNGTERVFCNELDETIEYIKKYNITFMGAVPAIYEYLYKKKDELMPEASHINMFMSGGAKLDPELVSAYEKIGIKLTQGYGLTECSPTVSMENIENNKKGSVGKIIPNLEIKLDNIDQKGVGEILVKGNSVMQGYFEDEKATKKVINDGWLNTGDLGFIDSEGYIFICGRNKNTIVLQNGKKVFPEEIEFLLNKIKGVKETLVFKGKNEKIEAIIVYYDKEFTKQSESKIKELLLKEIANINGVLPQYKRVNDIIITKKELERTPTGKIKRVQEENINKKSNAVNIKETSETNYEKLRRIIIDKFEIQNFDKETNIIKDLGADSLDILELFLQIEKEFNIKINRDERRKIATIEDIMNKIEIGSN